MSKTLDILEAALHGQGSDPAALTHHHKLPLRGGVR